MKGGRSWRGRNSSRSEWIGFKDVRGVAASIGRSFSANPPSQIRLKPLFPRFRILSFRRRNEPTRSPPPKSRGQFLLSCRANSTISASPFRRPSFGIRRLWNMRVHYRSRQMSVKRRTAWERGRLNYCVDYNIYIFIRIYDARSALFMRRLIILTSHSRIVNIRIAMFTAPSVAGSLIDGCNLRSRLRAPTATKETLQLWFRSKGGAETSNTKDISRKVK